MTELGDYRRLVERPMIEAHIAELRRKDAEIERLKTERDLFAARLGAERLGTPPLARENERLRAALTEIRQIYTDAPGWAAPSGDPEGLAWKMQDIARRATEQKAGTK